MKITTTSMIPTLATAPKGRLLRMVNTGDIVYVVSVDNNQASWVVTIGSDVLRSMASCDLHEPVEILPAGTTLTLED